MQGHGFSDSDAQLGGPGMVADDFSPTASADRLTVHRIDASVNARR